MTITDLGQPGYRGAVSSDARTIAQVLAPAGYRSFMSGKWHLSNPGELDGPTALTPVTAGASLLELAASSLNFGTHRSASLDHLGALVAGTAAYRLRWREPAQALVEVGGVL